MSPLRDMVHADPWAQEFVDLPSLNESASDAIVRTISHVRRTAREDPASLRGKSIVVLGPAGAGKTHLFARLRRSQGPRAVFVHVRPLIGAEMTPRYVLLKVVEQLGFETQGLRQADALVGSLMAHLKGHSTRMPRAFLNDLEVMGETEREQEIDSLLEQVVERWPHVDEAYLRKLLQVPFSTTLRARALLAWLSGREPDEAQLARIGAREGLRDDLVVSALKTIGAVAAPGAPIIIVFDQLENLVTEDGANRVRAYGNLIAELVDEIRGVVMVQMALDSEWARAIEPELATSQKSRAAMDTQMLALPTSAEREALLRLWSGRLPGHAPFPAPFGAERVRAWCEAPGLTPRMLLVACLRSLEQGAEDLPSDPLADTDPEQVGEAVGKAWSEHLARARVVLDVATTEERCVEAEAIADGWSVALRFVPGLRVISTSHLRAAQIVVERSADRVHVALLAKAHPRSLLATMDALARLAEREQVLVVRELSQPFKPTWRASIERRDTLLSNPRVQWLDLPRDDVARLLALRALMADARSRDVTDLAGRPLEEEAVRTWVELTLDVPAWLPLHALQTFGSDAVEPPLTPRDNEARQEASPSKPRADRPSSPKLTRGSTPSTLEPQSGRAAGPNRPSAPQASAAQSPRPETVLHTRGEALLALSRLRVASVDRVVREVVRTAPTRTRRSVLAELRSAPALVHWFGGTLVAWKEDAT